MDCKITNFEVTTNEVCLSQTAEIPIETDLPVSEKNDDIKRILKCIITPYISSKQTNSNMLTIEGAANITVIFLGADGLIYSESNDVPFKKSFESAKEIDGGHISISTNTVINYCRDITERKIGIKSYIKVDVRITTPKKSEIVSDIDCKNFETLKGNINVSKSVSREEKSVIIDEELNIPQNLPTIDRIIRRNAKVQITETKALNGKVIVKGNLSIVVIYCDADNAMQKFSSVLPFNQIIDMPDITEECECDSSVEICSLNISPRTDQSGNVTSIMIVSKLNITSNAVCTGEVPMIFDAYSTKYKSNIEISSINFTRIAKQVDETFLCKKRISANGNVIDSILDFWCDLTSCSTKFSENTMTVFGSLTIGAIITDPNGIIDCFDRIIDFEYPVELNENLSSPFTTPMIDVQNLNYSLIGNGEIDVKLELKVAVTIYNADSKSLITSAEVTDEKIESDDPSSLIAYFAEKGENIWEISKKFLANRNEFLELNGITESVVESPKMLLIPRM